MEFSIIVDNDLPLTIFYYCILAPILMNQWCYKAYVADSLCSGSWFKSPFIRLRQEDETLWILAWLRYP